MSKLQMPNCIPNSRFTELNPKESISDDIAKAIQEAINNNPNAFLGVMNLDGSLAYKLTVKAKNGVE